MAIDDARGGRNSESEHRPVEQRPVESAMIVTIILIFSQAAVVLEKQDAAQPVA